MSQQDSFTDLAPVGGSFTLNGRTFVIKPNVLSGRSMRAIRRSIAEINRIDLAKTVSHPGLSSEVVETICKHYKPETQIGYGDLVRAVQVPEVLASVLTVGVDELADYDEALAVVDEYPNYAELMGIVISACGLDTLKNSKAPATDEQEPGASASVPANASTTTGRTPQPPRPAGSLN